MLLSKYLGPFTYYNIILLFLFSLSVDSIKLFSIINSISYVIFHYVIIYLGLYYYRNILYFLYFVYGLGIDLLLINQIGPHLLLFMTLLFFFKRTKKYLRNFNSQKIYITILIIQIFVIFLEMLITQFLFGYNFNLYIFLKYLLISLVISYPILIIFNTIDRLN